MNMNNMTPDMFLTDYELYAHETRKKILCLQKFQGLIRHEYIASSRELLGLGNYCMQGLWKACRLGFLEALKSATK